MFCKVNIPNEIEQNLRFSPFRISRCALKSLCEPTAIAGVVTVADLGFLLVHHVPATVVTALGTYGVINMPCATVAALSDGRSHGHIMGAALCGTGL